ncbi:MAG: zinc ribbon domain-containing protein [Planctomycetes bacterium]|nr:zinc ribbon domain-containing protein [Planctomycetota bacterium]
MPIREFVCTACAHPFEELVLGAEQIHCPRCEAPDPERQLSAFQARGAAAPEPSGPGGCGTCGDPRGPGSCSLN